MRLRKINLAGFKSFVDPTTIEFPSDLVGIVGPNGCGKSNVIDAVRWVMGEISARHLRGDSMADVIFNGSSARKPVGQASVELMFDNADGRLAERYAAYAEISVRRQVGREGSSAYFLNGTRCRRRDVTDLFLGTGLGPRSYAVIEQGMISRIVEARPEELRDYLEEVAGISRYKDRRRDTENRMRHTQELLERLSDVRVELGKQLTRLDRQARQAERYKAFKAEERQLELELLALQLKRLSREATRHGQVAEAQATAVAGALAELRNIESALEQARLRQSVLADGANEAYRQVLEASAQVGRTEEVIDSLARREASLGDSLRREQDTLAEVVGHLSASAAQMDDLRGKLRQAEPALVELEEQMDQAKERFVTSERTVNEWQAGWEDLARRVRAPAEAAHAERARIESLEERLQRIAERAGRVSAERGSLDLAAAQAAVEEAAVTRELSEEQEMAAQKALQYSQDEVRGLREQATDSARRLHQLRAEHLNAQSAHASLSALQREALERNDAAVTRWIEANGLAHAGRLAQALRVTPGWEQAVEIILEQTLQALVVPRLGELSVPGIAGPLAVVATDDSPGATAAGLPDNVTGDALAVQVQPAALVSELLRGARTVGGVEEGIARRRELAPGEYFVTPEGARISWSTLQVPSAKDAQSGVIVRAQQIRELEQELALREAAADEAEEQQRVLQMRLQEAEARAELARGAANDAHRQYSAAVSQFNGARRELTALEERATRLSNESEEITDRRQQALEDLNSAKRRLTEATDGLARVETERSQWSLSRDELRGALERARDEWYRLRDNGYQLGLQVKEWRTRLTSLEESNLRYGQERARLEAHCVALEQELIGIIEPLREAREQLQERVAAHRLTEAALRDKRAAAEAGEAAQRELDAARTQANANAEAARETLASMRLEARESVVRRDTVREQIDQHYATLGVPNAEWAAVSAVAPGQGDEQQQPAIDPDQRAIKTLEAGGDGTPAAAVSGEDTPAVDAQQAESSEEASVAGGDGEAVFGGLPALLDALEEGADEATWAERLVDLARRISRLGAINLAAIDEHKELLERKTYLDAQHADLEEALATLEAAILRIDGETRTRFKDTFDKVNQGLAARFPKLFGGGQAYLQLSEDDLLTAGVSVMAQPPGKRNSTIQLLSGGEKALSAVALVFALFDLNPAPFCLLDEVDAPLDDANVGRFSELVREMAEHVQMLVVTHNKVTMEVAQQLVGVTMNEPGVSRLVAVDMDEAVAMVDS